MNQNYLWSFENRVEQKKKIPITYFTLVQTETSDFW